MDTPNVYTDKLYFDASTQAEAATIAQELELRGFTSDYSLKPCAILGLNCFAIISYPNIKKYVPGHISRDYERYGHKTCNLEQLVGMPVFY